MQHRQIQEHTNVQNRTEWNKEGREEFERSRIISDRNYGAKNQK